MHLICLKLYRTKIYCYLVMFHINHKGLTVVNCLICNNANNLKTKVKIIGAKIIRKTSLNFLSR